MINVSFFLQEIEGSITKSIFAVLKYQFKTSVPDGKWLHNTKISECIMFKDFEFTKFAFKTKYNNTVVYFVHSNCLFSRGKQEKNCWNIFLIQSTVNYIYCEQFFFI